MSNTQHVQAGGDDGKSNRKRKPELDLDSDAGAAKQHKGEGKEITIDLTADDTAELQSEGKATEESGCAACLLLEKETPAREHHTAFCDDCRDKWWDHFCADCGFFAPKLIGGTWCVKCSDESINEPYRWLGIEGGPERKKNCPSKAELSKKRKKAKCDCKPERAGVTIYHRADCAMIQSQIVPDNVTICDMCWSNTCPGSWGMLCSDPMYAGMRGKP